MLIRQKNIYYLLFTTYYLLLTGCANQNPLDRLINPVPKGATGTWTGNPWVIYDDELKTGGGMRYYASPDGQSLDFACRENPYQGSKCIKYSWDGREVYAYKDGKWQHNWCGFGLIVAKDYAGYDTTTKNLSPAGYTKVSFYARGWTSPNTYFRVEGPNGTHLSVYPYDTTGDITLTDSWQKYEFYLTGDMSSIKHFVSILFKYTGGTARGNGGIVYIDNIQFSP